MISKLNQVRSRLFQASCFMLTTHKQLRNFMINSTSDWITTPMEVLNTTPEGIVFSKGDITTILTNIGSPVRLPPVMAYSCDLRTNHSAHAALFYVAGQHQRFREDVLSQ